MKRRKAMDDESVGANVGADLRVRPLTVDEAKALPESERVAGLKVKGDVPPFGGSWSYDPAADELTLGAAPTADGGPRKGEEETK
jgi:hypothetical protein